MLSIIEVEEVRDKVREVGELADGLRCLMSEEGYSGAEGQWNIVKQLYELSNELTERIHAEERRGSETVNDLNRV